MNNRTKDWHIGMRGKIDYPETSLHGKEGVIEWFCGGEIWVSCDLGKFWLWHSRFIPTAQVSTSGSAGASKEEKQ
jgi:hypothetical protein